MAHKRTSQRKLSPAQFIKGFIIRLKLAKKVKVRDTKPRAPDAPPEARIEFQLIWRRIAILFVCLMLVGWLSLSTAAYFFVKHARDFPEVRFVDLAFPHRWEHYETSQGNYYIAKAEEKMEAGDRSGVLQLIRVGVQKAPDNIEGRLLLAQIYNSIGRPDRGIELLEARVEEHADDTSYIASLITLLFNNHEDAAVEELATRLLADSNEPTDRNLMLAVAAATANFNRGNYDRAQDFIDNFQLLESRQGALLRARMDWELGNREEAIAGLEKVLRNPGSLEVQVVDFLIDYLWKAGHHDRAERVAFSRFIDDPVSFPPRIRLLHIYAKRGATERVLAETETYFQLFGAEEEAMNALAGFAVRQENAELAERVYEHLHTKGRNSGTAALSLMEAHVRSGDYASALAFYEKVKEQVGDWLPLQRARLRPLLVATHFGVDDTETGSSLLKELLATGRVHQEDLKTLADDLVRMNKARRGREVLDHIQRNQPLNQEALTRLINLDILIGNDQEMFRNLKRLLEMRKPSPALLRAAHRHISSDRFLFDNSRGEILASLEEALNGKLQDS